VGEIACILRYCGIRRFLFAQVTGKSGGNTAVFGKKFKTRFKLDIWFSDKCVLRESFSLGVLPRLASVCICKCNHFYSYKKALFVFLLKKIVVYCNGGKLQRALPSDLYLRYRRGCKINAPCGRAFP
jgi:hypothetical protein